jgi:hypothetical protein
LAAPEVDTVWGTSDTGTNDDAKRHLMTLFPEQEVFDTPKPEVLLERIIHIATNPGETWSSISLEAAGQLLLSRRRCAVDG